MTDTNTAVRPSLFRDQRGFTLPELLVASFLTLTVSATAFSALIDANRTTEGVMAMSDVNQNLRVAMNVLIRDLLSTGEGIPTGGISFPTGGIEVVRPGPPASDWHFDAAWNTLPSVSPGNNIGEVVNEVQTDAVTLLYADHRLDFSGITLSAIADDGSSITVPGSVDITQAATAIVEGDLIMLTNGNGNTIQEVTSTSGQTIYFATTAESHLNQPGAPEGSIMDLRNDEDDDDLWPPTTITRVNMISYYIYVPTSGQITSPHLIRRVNWGDERVVAIGITNVQLTWDLVDGLTNPAHIPDPESPNTEHQIRKANLFMAARSLQTVSQTQQHVYSSLSTNVSLRSLAFVSRYDLQ
jgi:prepilin-type N-terminal cleavage/methylation domain-containing protein